VFVQEVANQVVDTYGDHEHVREHLGEIQDYGFLDAEGFETLNKPVLRLRVEGDKGKGVIVLYRRGSRHQKVVLEVDGQEFLLDDNPRDFFSEPTFPSQPGDGWNDFDEVETRTTKVPAAESQID
jgi:hypothetical protein